MYALTARPKPADRLDQVSESSLSTDAVHSTSFDSHTVIGPRATVGGVMAAIAGNWSQSFPATPDQVREARQFLRRLLGNWPRGDDALACLSELASNSVLHSNSRRPGGYFAVHVSLWPGMLRVAVEDEGGPWKHLHGGDDQRGRGLVIVEGLANDWSVIGNGAGARTVWFEICHP
jgi:anti-sigma regulatory factor (Ser/Thr protein kinase)